MKRDLMYRVCALATLSILGTCANNFAYAELSALDDHGLEQVVGQSAFYTRYIDPSASGNISGLGFFSLGLEGTLDINANIARLQLGCGGVNGPGCDIDLQDVRLTGTQPGPSGTYADSDAVLTNPFIQFAIKNPTSFSTRQVVGIAFGTQGGNALLSIGQNPKPNVAGSAGGQTGINTICGLIPVQASNIALSATLCTTTIGSFCVGELGAGNLPLLNTTTTPKSGINQPNGVFSSLVSGNRLTSLSLGPFALDARPLNGIGGALVSALGGVAYGSLAEDFIDVHNLNVSSTTTSGVLLTLNSQSILWPQMGTSGTSSFPTTTQYTNSNGSAITPSMLEAKTGWYLVLPTTSIGGTASDLLVTQNVLLGVLNSPSALQVLSYPGITIPSINLGQIPVQNCYGTLKFC